MGDQKTRREQRSLRLRRQTLRVLGQGDLEQVVGGVHVKNPPGVVQGRCDTRYCAY
jgi:hypothetical protein